MTETDVWLWLVFALGFTAGGVVIAVWAMSEVREMKAEVRWLNGQVSALSDWRLAANERMNVLDHEVRALQKLATPTEAVVKQIGTTVRPRVRVKGTLQP